MRSQLTIGWGRFTEGNYGKKNGNLQLRALVSRNGAVEKASEVETTSTQNFREAWRALFDTDLID